MLDLISYVLFAAFAVAQTAAILFTIFFKIAWGFNIRIVFVLLTAETLVDEMNENTLAQKTELHHTP